MTPEFVTVDLPDGPATGIITGDNRKTGDKRLVDVYLFPSRQTGQTGRTMENIPLDPADLDDGDGGTKPWDHGPYCARTGNADRNDTTPAAAVSTRKRPAGNATTDEWRDWAIDVHNLDADQAAEMSRADIQARYPE